MARPDYFANHPYIDFAVPAEEALPRYPFAVQGLSDLDGIEGTLVNRLWVIIHIGLRIHWIWRTQSVAVHETSSTIILKNSYYHLAAALGNVRGCPYAPIVTGAARPACGCEKYRMRLQKRDRIHIG